MQGHRVAVSTKNPLPNTVHDYGGGGIIHLRIKATREDMVRESTPDSYRTAQFLAFNLKTHRVQVAEVIKHSTNADRRKKGSGEITVRAP
jgi:hypothetical protein